MLQRLIGIQEKCFATRSVKENILTEKRAEIGCNPGWIVQGEALAGVKLMDAAGNCPEMCRILRTEVPGAVRGQDFPGNGTRNGMLVVLSGRSYGTSAILIVLKSMNNTVCSHRVNDKRGLREERVASRSLISRKQNRNLPQTLPWQNTGIQENKGGAPDEKALHRRCGCGNCTDKPGDAACPEDLCLRGRG